jgi:hypothetical protein
MPALTLTPKTDGHPDRVTLGCNFCISLFPEGCRRGTFLLAKLQTLQFWSVRYALFCNENT